MWLLPLRRRLSCCSQFVPVRPQYQNISSSDHAILKINMERLQSKAQYQVRVRAIPRPKSSLQGSWSDWSETFSFSTTAGDSKSASTRSASWEDKRHHQRRIKTLYLFLQVRSIRRRTHWLCVSFSWLWWLPVLFCSGRTSKKSLFPCQQIRWSRCVSYVIYFFFLHRILTFMWPSIPHPKHTLVQICKPNKVSPLLWRSSKVNAEHQMWQLPPVARRVMTLCLTGF